MNGLVRLTYDWGICRGPGPSAGCYLHPQGVRSPSKRAYLIIEARLVRSKIYRGRYALRCERLHASEIPASAPVYQLWWNKR